MPTKNFGDVKVGSTSVSRPIILIKTDGTADTGKVAANLTAYYYRQGASASVAVTLSDLSLLNTAFTSGGVKEISDGLYRIDWPDAAFVTGADWVLIVVKEGSTSFYPELVRLESSGAADIAGVLPSAAAGAANGLPVLDGSGHNLVYSVSQKVAATIASGDGVDAAAIKTTIGVAGAGLTALGDTRIGDLWDRFFHKVTFTTTDTITGSLVVYESDGTTVKTTQPVTGTNLKTETVGAAS